MDYEAFIKSKRIAERWGEAQAAFEQSDSSDEVVYYHELLAEFYDYIQYLEKKSFDFPAQDFSPSSLSEALEDVLPNFTVPQAEISENPVQKLIGDEEDPWFGFAE